MQESNTPASSIPANIVSCWVIVAIILPWLIAPAAAWRDGPEFIVSSWGLGIAHPAGFPLYQCLAWLWGHLPLASIGVRNHAFSAWLTLMAMLMLYYLAVLFLHVIDSDTTDKKPNSSIYHWLALLISICWFMQPAQLENAIQSEVYALHACFSFAVLALLLQFLRVQNISFYIAAAFLAGVGSANHIAMGVMLFALILAIGICKTWYKAWLTALAGILAGMAGLSLYILLPIRSRHDPAMDWGDAENWPRFWAHISDKKDAEQRFTTINISDTNSGVDMDSWWQHFSIMNDWLGSVPILLLFAGWLLLLLSHTRMAIICLSWLFAMTVLFIGWTSGTILTAVLGVILLGILPISIAIYNELTTRNFLLLAPILSIMPLIILFAYSSYAGWSFMQQRAPWLAKAHSQDHLLAMPYRATLIITNNWFHMLQMQAVEGMRPDLSIIHFGNIVEPQHFIPLKASLIPLLEAPQPAVQLIGTPSIEQSNAILSDLINRNSDKSKFFWDLDNDFQTSMLDYMGAGIGFMAGIRLSDQRLQCDKISTQLQWALQAHIGEQGALNDFQSRDKLEVAYMSWLRITLQGEEICPQLGGSLLHWWLQWMPPIAEQQAVLLDHMGSWLLLRGHEQGARRIWQQSYAAGSSLGGLHLGQWYAKHGQLTQARKIWLRVFLEYNEPQAYLSLHDLGVSK
ncbi:MAG: DUF2723 domain-containing protein [Mariprofundales bacterium]